MRTLGNVVDIISFGSEKPRRPPPRRLIVVGASVLSLAVVAVTAYFIIGDHRAPSSVTATGVSPTMPTGSVDGPPCQQIGWSQSPPVADSVAGLLIDKAVAGSGSTNERCDRTAAEGPWTVVVRRPDGSLGDRGAVVTFPVESPTAASTAARSVNIGEVIGKAEGRTVIWPLAGAHARIRGDLGEAELIAIAARTTVVAGRPAVQPPAGYAVAFTGPYRPPTIHQVRYATAAVGEQAALGDGLFYTGVTSGGGFEDRLYAVHTDNGGLVNGKPAVVSSVFDGNGALAWEPTPGVVAYVGYSGAELDDAAIAALQRLAGRTHVLTNAEWQATNPQTIDQIIEPS
ncbi:MAG TPA: hypothetical protein VFX61_15020 [Micromonosporaceae bacterium]|nr:hypothetical protein [Micromonosporaceae bacterium]